MNNNITNRGTERKNLFQFGYDKEARKQALRDITEDQQTNENNLIGVSFLTMDREIIFKALSRIEIIHIP